MSESKKRYKDKETGERLSQYEYEKTKYGELKIRVSRGEQEAIKRYAKELNKSVNELIYEHICDSYTKYFEPRINFEGSFLDISLIDLIDDIILKHSYDVEQPPFGYDLMEFKRRNEPEVDPLLDLY